MLKVFTEDVHSCGVLWSLTPRPGFEMWNLAVVPHPGPGVICQLPESNDLPIYDLCKEEFLGGYKETQVLKRNSKFLLKCQTLDLT